MAQRFDRLDRALGRLVFRGVGLLCTIVALGCGYAAWWHLSHWNPEHSLPPTILFAIAAVAAGSVVPYCFSRSRTFAEALDAMEGGAGDTRRPGKRP